MVSNAINLCEACLYAEEMGSERAYVQTEAAKKLKRKR